MAIDFLRTAMFVKVTAIVWAALLAVAATAGADVVDQDERVAMSDGVTLQTTVTGEAPLAARPTIVEFSPYGPGSATSTTSGPEYNKLLVQIRGTGACDGSFDAFGPRTQADVVETLRWACAQSWSNGGSGCAGSRPAPSRSTTRSTRSSRA